MEHPDSSRPTPQDVNHHQHDEVDESDSRSIVPRPPSKRGIAPLLALLLVVQLSTSLYTLPMTRVLERRFCREYYHQGGGGGGEKEIDEEFCKVDQVQRTLAWTMGVMDLAWIFGDFTMTIPLTFLGEKYGQKKVLLLNLVPRACMLVWGPIVGFGEETLPASAVLVGPILSVLGGDCVFNSLTYSLAAGLSDDFVTRATYFGWMSSVSYIVNLLGPAIASLAMTAALWLPFVLGLVLLGLAIPAIFLLPRLGGPSSSDEQRQPLISSPILKAQTAVPSIISSVKGRVRKLWYIVSRHPRNLTLLLISFFLTSLASSDTKLLAQYISKRYGWTFASAGYLLSAKAVVNFILLTLVIPTLLRSGRSASDSEAQTRLTDRTNLTFVRVCLLISVIGAAAIAASGVIWLLFPSLIIYALGSALPVFTLSLLKSPSVSPRGEDHGDDGGNNGREPSESADSHLFSLTMMVKTLGSLLGAFLMPILWVRGIDLGGAALGVPYYVSAGVYAAAIVVFSNMVLR